MVYVPGVGSSYPQPLSVFIHVFVVILVIATRYVLHPRLVIQIPFDGLHDTVLKLGFRIPTQFVCNLGRIDGITLVVPQTVFYKRNERIVSQRLPVSVS